MVKLNPKATHPQRVKVQDLLIPQVDDCTGPMAAQVYRYDELVTLCDLLAGLAPPFQPHL